MMAPGGLPALTCADHAPRSRLPDEKGALEIDPQHAVEIRFRQVEEIGARG